VDPPVRRFPGAGHRLLTRYAPVCVHPEHGHERPDASRTLTRAGTCETLRPSDLETLIRGRFLAHSGCSRDLANLLGCPPNPRRAQRARLRPWRSSKMHRRRTTMPIGGSRRSPRLLWAESEPTKGRVGLLLRRQHGRGTLRAQSVSSRISPMAESTRPATRARPLLALLLTSAATACTPA